MESFEYIDNFYQQAPSPEEAGHFESKMHEDPEFAEQVAIYLSFHQVAKEGYAEETRNRFREIYLNNKLTTKDGPVRKLWYYAAAAAIIASIVFGVFKYNNNSPQSRQQLATLYVNEHLQTLGVKMSGETDKMQSTLNLYNQKKYAEALQGFEEILATKPNDFETGMDAGRAALQLKQYDKAIHYFSSLQSETNFSNPALFYHALTLMLRNQTGDQDAATKMLQQVVDEKLEGEDKAREWLH